jgi:PAS domain S-box-containing protein
VSVADPLIQATLLSEAFDNGPVAIFVVGDDLRYVAVNRSACELLGYEREELLGLTAREVMPDVDVDELLLLVIRDRRRSGRWTFLRKGGEPVEVEFRASEASIAGMPFLVSACWPVAG